MQTAKQTLDQAFLEMRWRCLSLAADLDRIERCPDGPALIASDPRLHKLRQVLAIVQQSQPHRAQAVQMLFSDLTPPPAR